MRYAYNKGVVKKFSTKFINLSTALVLVATSLSGAAPLFFAQKALAAGTTVVSPANMDGWSGVDDNGYGGSLSFVNGPGATPLGTGSAQLNTTTTSQGYMLAKSAYGGTKLSALSNLSYETYVQQGNNTIAPSLQLNITSDVVNNATWQGRLVYEPYQNGHATVTDGVWQPQNALSGLWWLTKPALFGNNCGQSTPCTLGQIESLYPDAGISTSQPLVGFKAGSNWVPFIGNVDDFVINDDTYDFEASPPAAPSFTGFTQNQKTLACGAVTNTIGSSPYTTHIQWTSESDISQYAITPTYPDGHGQYTYYPSGSASDAWIGDNFGHHGQGVYSYTIKAQGTNGLWSTASAPCTLTYDTIAPTVSVSPVAGSLLHGVETFNITINDANPATPLNKSVYVYLYDTAGGQKSWGTKVDLSSGSGTFTVNTALLDDGNANLDVGLVKDAAGNPTVDQYHPNGTDSYFKNYTIDNTAPAVPTNLSWLDSNGNPATNGFTNVQKGTLSWQDSDPSVDHYLYKFWTNIPGYFDGMGNAWTTDNPSYFTTSSTGASIWTNFDNYEGTYYFCVESVDAVGNTSICSDTYTVTYDKTAPAAPSITAPTLDQYFNILPIVDSWTTVTKDINGNPEASGIDHYQVAYLYDDGHTFGGSTCAGEQIDSKTLSGCRDINGTSRDHVPAITEQGGVTIWVRAIDGAGNVGAWSASTHYYYDTTVLAAPTLISPQDGAFVNGASVTNVWSSVTGATKYEYESFNSSDTSQTPRWDQDFSTTSKTATNVADGTVFYWRVRAIDQYGKTGPWSGLWKITVDNTSPAKPAATPGAGDYYNGSQLVTLTSSDSGSGLAAIYYTTDTDGTTIPSSSNGTKYTGPITVSQDEFIEAIAYDKAGNVSTVMTAQYGIAPVISDESSQAGVTTATITWTTNNPATSRVVYDTVSHPSLGSAPDYGYATSTPTTDQAPNEVTNHSVTITGLDSGTTYYFRTVSDGSPASAGSEITATTKTVPSQPNNKVLAANISNNGDNGSSSNTPANTAVLGASTTNPNNSGNQKDNTLAATDTAKGNSFLGLGWWWLLVVAAVLALIYGLTKRNSHKKA